MVYDIRCTVGLPFEDWRYLPIDSSVFVETISGLRIK